MEEETKTMYRLIMVLGLVAATCLVLGCGSSRDEATSAPLTTAQFIKQAGAICGKYYKDRKSEAAKWLQEQPGGPAEAESHYDEGFKVIVAPSMRREAKELEALAAPEQDVGKLALMVGNFKRASDAVAEEGRRGLLNSALKRFESEAEHLKISNCANPL
jgi:hypothetical protein